MKKYVNVWDYAGHIMEHIGGGILLTTKADDKVNTMTIGWGTIGVQWGKPIFIAFVRESRYTKQLLEANGEFAVNVPMKEANKNVISVCGTVSGRDADKLAQLGLTTEEGETVSVPAIRELPLTLECKVIYKQAQEPAAIFPEYDQRFYTKGTRNEGDYHIAYYGEITAAYIVE